MRGKGLGLNLGFVSSDSKRDESAKVKLMGMDEVTTMPINHVWCMWLKINGTLLIKGAIAESENWRCKVPCVNFETIGCKKRCM